ncbi:AAA family ATPase [Agromyces sp. CFH 90414]|uniref:AAA family ATPase n=1 Tax=Agromyces agglutinans TaxID=2662258 RepID=A0A6I2F2K6_9MICO|nr:RNA polymerase recycling motor ATPase HelR [Agromyces agglutinans]MRG58391.1 AAA family ATPase [Agromyces agglutinans]
MTSTTSVFDLPERLAAKRDAALIETDERQFAAIATSLDASIAEVSERLAAARRAPGGSGQAALDRDLEVHRLTAELRTLRRYGLDLCLGRMVPADGGEPTYIGRIGLSDGSGRRLLVDWRSPAAEPFFAATLADPMGLASRRRYRWTRGRITDYWDEVLRPETFGDDAGARDGGRAGIALDDESAFIASLAGTRTSRMRDVLGTIQADQDAITRAGSRGALVVDGGPGTGKTVVALHRTAYLLYADPRLSRGRGGMLLVGPSQGYLAYIEDVLPSLGEEGVQSCTLRDLVVEGAAARPEADPSVAALKASGDLVRAVENAVKYHEQPPARGMAVETEWADAWLDPADWADAFGAADDAPTHNEARDRIWEELVTILLDQHDEDAPAELVRRSLAANAELRAAFNRAWPLLDPVGVVGDLWSVPAYLQACAPWLDEAAIASLQRADATAWTLADLPLLDTARQLIGDPEASRRRYRRAATLAVQRERMARVVDDLIAADDDGEGLVTMLRGSDAQHSLDDEGVLPVADPDVLAGPFGHVVVDEAQELTDAEWLMLLRRCPSRSFTIVGDRAQARHGFVESWQERLGRIGVGQVELASLSINYRTPREVMAVAESAIRAELPDANVPTSVRSSGIPVRYGSAGELNDVLDAWIAEHEDGVACVIGAPSFAGRPRVRSLTPELAKGLEFDLVVVVDPERFGHGVEGAVDRYVAMTRATRELVVLRSA